MAAEQQILGRSHGDADKLFPRYTVASAATTGQVEVNGKTIHLWEYAQLEPLSTVILRKRAQALRDVLGPDACPAIPCGHTQDLIRYILDVQAQVTNCSHEVGPPKIGRGGAVPGHFLHETKASPQRAAGYPTELNPAAAPFGPRTAHDEHRGKRDSFRDLRECKKEFQDVEHHMNLGIQSLRPGGEGRRHIYPETSIAGCGVPVAAKGAVEGRKYLGCRDNVFEQKKEMEAVEKGLAKLTVTNHPRLSAGPPDKHPSNSVLRDHGNPDEDLTDPHIGGERRKHMSVPDNMEKPGMSKSTMHSTSNGRRHLEAFGGPKQNHSDSHDTYKATWKKDPSRLHGTSLLI